MDKKPSTTELDKSPPTIVRVIVTAPVALRVNGAKPEANLFLDSNGHYVVSFCAWQSEHGKVFDNYSEARQYFGQLTGNPVPNSTRRIWHKPARVGSSVA